MMARTLSSRTTKVAVAWTPLMLSFTLSIDASAPAVSFSRFASRASSAMFTWRLFTSSVISSTERLGTSSSTSGGSWACIACMARGVDWPGCAAWRRFRSWASAGMASESAAAAAAKTAV